MPRLEIRTGRHAGKTYDLTKNVILGRGDTADIQLPDGKASREHARVFKQAGKWAVADLNSRNGIKVNGLKATRKDLFDGDQFEVGETLVGFLGDAASSPPQAKTGFDQVEELDVDELDLDDEGEPAAAYVAPVAEKPRQSAKDKAFAAARAKASEPKKQRSSGGGGGGGATGIDVSKKVLQFSKVDANKSSFLSIDLAQYSTFTQFLIWCAIVAVFGTLIWFLFKMLAESSV